MNPKVKSFPWEGDIYIKPTEAAQILQTTNRALREWRERNYGPTYIRYEGGPIMYSLASVRRFEKKNIKSKCISLDLL